MYNVHLTHSLLCFEFVELTLNNTVSNESGPLWANSIAVIRDSNVWTGRSDNRNSGIAGLKIEYPKLSIT